MGDRLQVCRLRRLVLYIVTPGPTQPPTRDGIWVAAKAWWCCATVKCISLVSTLIALTQRKLWSLVTACSSTLEVIGTLYNYRLFTARCYASAVLAMALCPSVRPSVCPSQVGVLLKRLNIGSHKQHHTIAQGFWCQRSQRNSTGVIPYRGAKYRWGGSKSASFDK